MRTHIQPIYWETWKELIKERASMEYLEKNWFEKDKGSL